MPLFLVGNLDSVEGAVGFVAQVCRSGRSSPSIPQKWCLGSSVGQILLRTPCLHVWMSLH